MASYLSLEPRGRCALLLRWICIGAGVTTQQLAERAHQQDLRDHIPDADDRSWRDYHARMADDVGELRKRGLLVDGERCQACDRIIRGRPFDPVPLHATALGIEVLNEREPWPPARRLRRRSS